MKNVETGVVTERTILMEQNTEIIHHSYPSNDILEVLTEKKPSYTSKSEDIQQPYSSFDILNIEPQKQIKFKRKTEDIRDLSHSGDIVDSSKQREAKFVPKNEDIIQSYHSDEKLEITIHQKPKSTPISKYIQHSYSEDILEVVTQENEIIKPKTVSFLHQKITIKAKLHKLKIITVDELISEYRSECIKSCIKPSHDIEKQLKLLDAPRLVLPSLALNTIKLDRSTVECLEILFIKLMRIEHVCLRGAQMSDDVCQVLFEIFAYYDSIVHLEAGSNIRLGLQGWTSISKYISSSTTLEILDLGRTIFTELFVTLISHAIYSSYGLKTVILNNCHLNNELMKAFGACIKKNDHIEEIYLSENKISSYDCQHVGEIICNCSSLKIIDLENNPIQDSGFLLIMDFLCTLNIFWLECLYLWNTGITSSTMYKLGEYLEGGSSRSKIALKTLNIGKNRIQDDGISTLKLALIKNTSLKKLGMASVKFSSIGIVTLAEIIADNRSLLLLDIRDNIISISGLLALSHSIKHNRTMVKIYLNTNFKVDRSTELEFNKLLDEIKIKCQQNSKNSRDEDDSDISSMISSSTCDLHVPPIEGKPTVSSVFNIFYSPWQYAKSKIFSMFFKQDVELNLEIPPDITSSEVDLANNKKFEVDSSVLDSTRTEFLSPIAESKNTSISDSCGEIVVGSRFTVKPVNAGHRRCHSETTVLNPRIRENIRSEDYSIKMSKPLTKLPSINIIPSDDRIGSPSSKKSRVALQNTFPPYRSKSHSCPVKNAFKDIE